MPLAFGPAPAMPAGEAAPATAVRRAVTSPSAFADQVHTLLGAWSADTGALAPIDAPDEDLAAVAHPATRAGTAVTEPIERPDGERSTQEAGTLVDPAVLPGLSFRAVPFADAAPVAVTPDRAAADAGHVPGRDTAAGWLGTRVTPGAQRAAGSGTERTEQPHHAGFAHAHDAAVAPPADLDIPSAVPARAGAVTKPTGPAHAMDRTAVRDVESPAAPATVADAPLLAEPAPNHGAATTTGAQALPARRPLASPHRLDLDLATHAREPAARSPLPALAGGLPSTDASPVPGASGAVHADAPSPDLGATPTASGNLPLPNSGSDPSATRAAARVPSRQQVSGQAAPTVPLAVPPAGSDAADSNQPGATAISTAATRTDEATREPSQRVRASHETPSAPVLPHSPIAQGAEPEAARQTARTAEVSVPAREPELADQMVQAIRVHVTQGGGEARVHLRPEYLGELTVRVVVEDGRVTAQLEAAVPAVREWIERHEGTLRQALAEHGLTLDALHVHESSGDDAGDLSERDGDSGREADERPRRRRRHEPDGPRFEVDA